MEEKTELSNLIQKVMINGDRTAVKKLAYAGMPGIVAALKAMNGPYPSERHPKDVAIDLKSVLTECAKFDINGLKDIIEKNQIPPDPEMVFVVSALRSSPQKEKVAETLIPVLKHSNQYVRWVAAEVMIETREKSTIKPLTDALRDRAVFVKETIVDAMKEDGFFRNQEAIKYLEKITLNKTIRKNYPHLCQDAQLVIDMIKAETDGSVL